MNIKLHRNWQQRERAHKKSKLNERMTRNIINCCSCEWQIPNTHFHFYHKLIAFIHILKRRFFFYVVRKKKYDKINRIATMIEVVKISVKKYERFIIRVWTSKSRGIKELIFRRLVYSLCKVKTGLVFIHVNQKINK